MTLEPQTLEAQTLDGLQFDNSFVRQLPADPESRNHRRQVLGACFSRVAATRVRQPRLVACAREVAEMLGLSPEACAEEAFAEVFGGNRLLPGMESYAACYGGHQFGNWAGQLGDGRALGLGEVVHRGQRWELQLKGAGPTPYSRSADGRAVMRSSVREFLCSEAMHHLGVPTTRALSLVATGDEVVRDMFYDGHPKPEPGAVVCRVAPSFIRFGNFEIFTSRQDHEVLRRLADYTITTHFPELGEPSKEVYLGWLEEVCRRTAVMIAHWMRVGFVHGVMNTDNMSILGLTIDYGPYGWLDNYDPDWTPNTTDAGGRRYRFGHQPQIALWNLVRLAEAIYPLIEAVEPLEEALQVYSRTLGEEQRVLTARKLGLKALDGEADEQLVSDLYTVLQRVETDMTIFFRQLAEVSAEGPDQASEDQLMAPLTDAYYAPDELTADDRAAVKAWLERYRARVREDGTSDAERRAAMHAVNPKYVLRNYLAQLAIDKAEEGDGSLVAELLEVMRRPYDEQPDKEEYAGKRPEWARHRPGCSMLSCSS
ncbi:MAG: YdiU family protein [Acidobacteriota bacterium]